MASELCTIGDQLKVLCEMLSLLFKPADLEPFARAGSKGGDLKGEGKCTCKEGKTSPRPS